MFRIPPKFVIAALVVGIVGGLWVLYPKYLSPTRIAFIGFHDVSVAGIMDAREGLWVNVERFESKELLERSLDGYAVVFFNTHGLHLTDEARAKVLEAARMGVLVHTVGATDPKASLTNLGGEHLARVNGYFKHGGRQNMHGLLAYARTALDGKSMFGGTPGAVVEMPAEGFFQRGEGKVFGSLETYEDYCEKNGLHRLGAPKVALFTGFLGPKNPYTRRHHDALIGALEARGINVYPVFGFRKSLEYLRDIAPDLIIHAPHGRFAPGREALLLKELKSLNAPMLLALNVMALEQDWQKDPQGMDGGMLSQSVVLPELDGATAPYVIATLEKNPQGLEVIAPLSERIEVLAERAERWLRLRKAPNADKKVAIFYYKGQGKNAMVASSLEIAPSLLAMLQAMKARGYATGPLPKTADELYAKIQKHGPVLPHYAKGMQERFFAQGDPAKVPASTLDGWLDDSLSNSMRADLQRVHGPLPGKSMVVPAASKESEPSVAVARVTFGNVVLLPVPSLGTDDDDDYTLVHEAKEAPAYPYLAAYLWAREGFDADAMIHVGTHGSLEFLPWKQVALSSEDWSDALIGPMPHLYLYDVEDPGEAMVAKRRSYAAMVDHLTAPFMRAGLNKDLAALDARMHDYLYGGLAPGLKESYGRSVIETVKTLNLHKDLALDIEKMTTDEAIKALNQYVHDLELTKVGRGRYVLGRVYSKEEVRQNVMLASAERVADGLAGLDKVRGKINSAQYEDKHRYVTVYLKKAQRMVTQVLQGEKEALSFLAAADLKRLEAWDAAHAPKRRGHGKGARRRGEAVTQDPVVQAMDPKRLGTLMALLSKPQVAKSETSRTKLQEFLEALEFYIDHGYLADRLPKDDAQAASLAAVLGEKERLTWMRQRAGEIKGRIAAMDAQESAYVNAIALLKEALVGVHAYRDNLLASPGLELNALLNGLEGGYIAPGPGGDPLFNPQALPTGRNLSAIDAESVPSKEAWALGQKLAEKALEKHRADHGHYPQKVALTFWSSEFLKAKGVQLSQVFHLLGVAPVWNAYGQVKDIRLVPQEALGRPRIDVVVQTSGQFRDLAASRIYLINRAVAMAAAARAEGEEQNFVHAGALAAEASLKKQGLSPKEARRLATQRVFGGVNGSYGTNIMGLVESGDDWQDVSEVAETYINNMGAMYDEDHWGQAQAKVFRAALLNAEMVLQPRSSNVYGPLNLDHVYEFMGGLSLAIRQVNGKDPAAYFNDMRNPNRLRVQAAKEAIWQEARTTLLNPAWIKEYQEEGATAAEEIAEITRDMYGWEVMKPSEVDSELWQEHYEVYVEDRYGLGLREYFETKNPYALQEVTAVMLETIRKGLWQPEQAVVDNLAKVHGELVRDFEAGCSGFVCDNEKLSAFIAAKLAPELKAAHTSGIRSAREGEGSKTLAQGQRMTKEEEVLGAVAKTDSKPPITLVTLSALGASLLILAVLAGRRQRQERV